MKKLYIKKINIENFRFNYPIYSSIFDIKSVSLINMLELVCNILRNYTFHNKVIPDSFIISIYHLILSYIHS